MIQQVDIFLSEDGSAVFNEQSNNVDFRIESNNETHMFFVDGADDRIGIGLADPVTTVHIKDTDPAIRLQRADNANRSSIEFAGKLNNVGAVVSVGDITHESNTNDLVFSTHNGLNPEEVLRLGSHFVIVTGKLYGRSISIICSL